MVINILPQVYWCSDLHGLPVFASRSYIFAPTVQKTGTIRFNWDLKFPPNCAGISRVIRLFSQFIVESSPHRRSHTMSDHLINNWGRRGVQMTDGRVLKYLASAGYAPEAHWYNCFLWEKLSRLSLIESTQNLKHKNPVDGDALQNRSLLMNSIFSHKQLMFV